MSNALEVRTLTNDMGRRLWIVNARDRGKSLGAYLEDQGAITEDSVPHIHSMIQMSLFLGTGKARTKMRVGDRSEARNSNLIEDHLVRWTRVYVQDERERISA